MTGVVMAAATMFPTSGECSRRPPLPEWDEGGRMGTELGLVRDEVTSALKETRSERPEEERGPGNAAHPSGCRVPHVTANRAAHLGGRLFSLAAGK